MAADAAGISLRPGGAGISLRPGGAGGGVAGGFTAFAMGSRPQAPSESTAKRLSSEDVIKYTKDFIMAFQERYKDMPVELATSPLEVVINDVNEDLNEEEEGGDGGQWGKKSSTDAPDGSGGSGGNDYKGGQGGGAGGKGGKGGGDGNKSDGRDWHAKPTPSPSSGSGGDGSSGKQGGKGGKGGGGAGGGEGGQAGRKGGGRVDLTPLPEGTAGATIVKAANAWSRGGSDDDHTRVTRAIKGILNKITPEKFDRLMEQLLESGINTAQTLSETISIVFDKAIWEPGFCSMYADVCVRLSKELPEFPGEDGGKPMTFRRILLNTCQEEFEGAGKAREELNSISDAAEKASAAKRVKVRTMGNIKLIGELFKKKMIAEKILHACVSDLLGPPKSEPPEENIEALCNLLATVGKEMDASPKLPKQMMEMYFARLKALSESATLDSRIRFLCRDVIELRKAKWVPRVKKLEAKTLDEIHAEAAAALGIAPAAAQEEILFPEGPGGPSDGWEVVGKGGKSSSNNLSAMTGGAGKTSSLSGPYVAATHRASMPTEKEKAKRDAELRKLAREKAAVASAPGGAAGGGDAAAAAAAEGGDASSTAPAPAGASYDAEKVEEKVASMITEYMQVADVKEAVLCVKDIQDNAKDADAAVATAAAKMVSHVIDSSQEKARDLIIKLLVACKKDCGVAPSVIAAALAEPVGMLDDLAIDIPMAPKLLGVMTAQLVIEGVLEMAFFATSAESVEDMLYRREYAAAVLKELKAKGKEPAAAYVKDGGVDLPALLTGDPEFDSPLPEFLEKSGLKELC